MVSDGFHAPPLLHLQGPSPPTRHPRNDAAQESFAGVRAAYRTLYYQRADNADLVRKKTRFFAERIRSTMAVDILESVLSDDTVSTIARRTGMKEKEVEDFLKRLRMDYCTEGNIDDKEMKWAIDTINAITERI